MKKISIIIFLILPLLLTGCMSMTVPIHADEYKPNVTVNKKMPVTAKVFSLQVNDLRGGDPTFIDVVKITRDTEFGPITTFWNYKLSEPVTQFVNKALMTGLTQQGIKIYDSAPYKLKVEILQTHVNVDLGVLHNTITFQISTNFVLINTKTNETIWKSRFNATGIAKTKVFTWKDPTSPTTNMAMDSALDNLITQVVNDPSFITK